MLIFLDIFVLLPPLAIAGNIVVDVYLVFVIMFMSYMVLHVAHDQDELCSGRE